jgi:flavin reductase (DIM6/NTAB) family NADH-FMN oxidoreductase RutF
MPRIEGALAWIDCEIDAVHDAGDHHIVVGRVRHLELDTPESPLIFFQGGYGGFAADRQAV